MLSDITLRSKFVSRRQLGKSSRLFANNNVKYIVFLAMIPWGCSLATSTPQDKPTAVRLEQAFEIPRGLRTDLEIVAWQDIQPRDLNVVQPPSHGILRPTGKLGTLAYQHGGASKQPDQFAVSWQDRNGVEYTKSVELNFREISANVRITSPIQDEVVPSGSITITYELRGVDFDHLHIALDHEGHNTIRDLSGSFRLNGLTPGIHTISAQLVDKNHRSLRASHAYDEVTVNVR